MAAINLGRLERIPEGEAIVVDAAEAGTAGDIAAGDVIITGERARQ